MKSIKKIILCLLLIATMCLLGACAEQGPQGETGTGIVSIEKIQSEELIDTYKILYSNGEHTTFTVKNGQDGIQGIQGVKGDDGHTPIITIQNGYWHIDGISTEVKAEGVNGEQGLSAYELFIKYNPNYTKNEQEWLDDLATGRLSLVTITFDTDGGSAVENQVISFGTYAQNIEPKKDGYIFKSWSLNGSEIDINTFTFFTDSQLVAVYTPKTFDVTLNPDNGLVDYNTTTITYGENYSLPVPQKEYMSFANWYLGEVKIPNNGVWTYSQTGVQLKAVYNTTKIYANLTVDEQYGTIDTNRERLTVGENYTLPVPLGIEGGLSFQGWYNGDRQYTDKNGESLGILTDTSTLELTAKYFTEINDIHQIIAMGSAESTTGNFVLTKDLDFSGVEMTPINNFSGVFDGNGHTISNVTINKGTGNYGGFFGTVNNSTTIKNLKFDTLDLIGNWDNGNENQYSGGLIGKVVKTLESKFEVDIINITLNNCLNNSSNLTGRFGLVVGLIENNSKVLYFSDSYYTTVICDITMSEISILNSGQSLQDGSSYCIGATNSTKKVTSTNSYGIYTQWSYYPLNIKLENYTLISNFASTGTKYGVLSKVISTTETITTSVQTGTSSVGISDYTRLEINKFNNSVNGLHAGIAPDYCGLTINVSNSQNTGNIETAWGSVNSLKNSINLGECLYWGANVSENCVDINEITTYNYSINKRTENNIRNSIILFENADGSYYYFTSGGQQGTINNITLLTKDLFITLLSFDETIWDLDNFDLSNGTYPTLR